MFNKKVFHPDTSKLETRAVLAAAEAVKTKRCLQALRYLWRNAKGSSHCPKVQELKSHLTESPLQNKQSKDAESSGDAEPSSSEAEAWSDDEAIPGDGEERDNMVSIEHGENENESEGEGDEGEDAGACSGESADEESCGEDDPIVEHHAESDNDSLTAPTLRLSDCVSSQESHEPIEDDMFWRDSQVSDNWLGAFYAKFGKFGKDESSHPDAPECVHKGDLKGICEHIQDTFAHSNPDTATYLL